MESNHLINSGKIPGGNMLNKRRSFVSDSLKNFGWLFFTGLIALLLFSSFTPNQIDDKEILKAIRKGKTQKLKQYIEEGLDVNGLYKDRKLLNYAVRKGEYEVCELLIESGAYVNKFHDNQTPLIQSVHSYRPEIMELLIAFGADPDLADSKGNTALTHAVLKGELELVRVLFESGASRKIKNNKGRTPFHYVNRYHENSVLEYVNKVKILHHHLDTLPDLHDGPHITIKDNRLKVEYFLHDSSANKTWREYKFFTAEDDTFAFDGFAGDSNTYHLDLSFETSPAYVSQAEKIFLLGDLHGEYETLGKLLRNQQIIDAAGKWDYGKGHVVFTGDVFDRGDKVTETLWFIHELKYQAQKSGGDVHFLLGNHEMMALEKDYRYLASKYLFFSQFFLREYGDWYSNDTYIGKWIRKKNVAMKVDDKLIVHAGFSPRVLNQKLSLEEINSIFRLHMNNKKYKVLYIHDLVVSGDGPTWYRGYVTKNLNYTEVEQTLVEKTLKFYGASKLIVGHMPQYTIKALFNKQVYLIDVPMGQTALAQGLLIEGEKYYKCSEDGQRVRIE